MMKCLRKQFHEHFEVVRVNNPRLLRESLKIRYQVYCLEQGYEDPNHFPHGMESDIFDHHADHSIITHKASGQTIGSVRVVVAASDHNKPFPIEQHFQSKYKGLLDTLPVDRRCIGEVSRFAISNKLRRFLEPDRHDSMVKLHSTGESGAKPAIGFLYSKVVPGLFNAIVNMSMDHNLTHWVCLVDPSMFRLLSQFGFRFKPFGPANAKYGNRRPFYAEIDEELDRIYRQNSELWDMITNQGELWSGSMYQKLNHIA